MITGKLPYGSNSGGNILYSSRVWNASTVSRRAFWALVLSTALTSPGQAQTASQISPPSYAPFQVTPQGPVTVPQDMPSTAPEGADKVDVQLNDVVIEGGTLDAATLAALKMQLTGKAVKASEIFVAARKIEAALARDGRILTRVIVPAQSLSNAATLRLVIVQGQIERIDTGALPVAGRARSAGLLAPLAGRADVTQREIERRLLLAGDVPGTSLRSTLTAGSTPGATVLVVEARYRPVMGFLTADNSLPATLGRHGFGLGLTLNSMLGAGETIYLRANGLPTLGRKTSFLETTPRNRALAGGVILPLGLDGLTFNVELTDARTAPRHAASLPGFASRFRRLSNRLRYPVIRSRALTISTEASLDLQDEQVRIIEPAVFPLSLDRLRIVRGAGDVAAWLPGGGSLTGRVEASFGLNALGARSADDASPLLPLSRAGSDASFHKLELAGGIEQPVAAHLTLSVRARAQTSFGQVMANAEQIGIATQDGISPLPSGTIQGDVGYVGRAELRAPFVFALPFGSAQLAPYGFAAVGGVRLQQPTAFERRRTGATAHGLGLRLSGNAASGSPGLSAGVEYGRAHVGGRGHADRVAVTLITQF